MKRNKRILLAVLLAVVLTFSLSACFNKYNKEAKRKEYIKLIETEPKTYTLAELKSEFEGAKEISSEFSGNYTFKPFYNVDQTTEFTFHFNSEIDPVKAVTVHTDSKCEDNSTVYQINDGYKTENGVDVVVKPKKAMGIVLDTEDRNDHSKDAKWGYASVYYLCVRYDLDATEPTKLENPIIIPFTIRNEIDTPEPEVKVDDQGNLFVEWDKIANAVEYKIYESYGGTKENYTREECGYSGDHLSLLYTVDADTLRTYQFDKESLYEGHYNGNATRTDKEYNMFITDDGYVMSQNRATFSNLYISAVDANGNESQFSKALTIRNYEKQIPSKIDGKANELYENKNQFLDQISVVAADGVTVKKYPINYYKIYESDEYFNYCTYRYEVVGTALTGTVNYTSEERIYPEEVISKAIPPVTFMKDTKLNINQLPSVTSDVFIDSEYQDAYIDITTEINYPEDAKIKYDPALLVIRMDIEGARMINKGLYTEEFNLDEIESYVLSENPEYILTIEDGVIIVEKANKDQEEAEEPEDKQKLEIEVKDPLAAKDKKVITSNNYVTEQRKSTEKQVKEADLTEIKGTNYPIFAETAEQKYLALSMINHKREVSLKAFPALQNQEYLVDSLYYVYFQNPYVLDLDIPNCSYSDKEQMLYLEYEFDDETYEKQKKEIYLKANQVIDEIIKPGMTDYEKTVAIWEYLEKNTVYEIEAYEYAKQNNFSMEGATGFENTFNTYGILCNGKGVCQSYAYTFKLLAHTCGIESDVVVGTMNNVDHAWNAIKIDGKWYMIDTTNNINAIAIPYWVFQTSSDFIEGVGYRFSDEFVTGYDYSDYLNSSIEQDYYTLNSLMPKTNKECGEMLAELWHNRKNDEEVAAVKYKLTSQLAYDSVMQAFLDEIKKKGHSSAELSDWMLGTTEGMVVVANMNYYQ